MIDIEAKNLLDKVARKSKAKMVLASASSVPMLALASSLAATVVVYVMADFTAPIPVKILIGFCFVSGVLSQMETWRLQRRLDAAIELLHQSEDARD